YRAVPEGAEQVEQKRSTDCHEQSASETHVCHCVRRLDVQRYHYPYRNRKEKREERPETGVLKRTPDLRLKKGTRVAGGEEPGQHRQQRPHQHDGGDYLNPADVPPGKQRAEYDDGPCRVGDGHGRVRGKEKMPPLRETVQENARQRKFRRQSGYGQHPSSLPAESL